MLMVGEWFTFILLFFGTIYAVVYFYDGANTSTFIPDNRVQLHFHKTDSRISQSEPSILDPALHAGHVLLKRKN